MGFSRTVLPGGPGGTLDSEQVRDIIGAALVAGTNVTITVNDAGDTITISATGGGSYTDEQVRDVIGAALVQGSGITIAVNDAGDTITISSAAIPVSVVDFKGDLVVGTGADTVGRLAAGADGVALVGMASATQGLAYLGFPVYRLADTYSTADYAAAIAAVPASVPAAMPILVRIDGT